MSCKKYIAAILLCSVLLAGCSGFSGRGTDARGAESPASGGSSTEGQAVQVVPETLARQLAAVQSAHPLTEEFFSWCAQEAPSGLLEGIDDRLEAEALYSDAWFYDLCGISLHVLYGRYSGQDSGSNWHEREGGNGAAEIIFAGDVNLDDDWEIMRHLKDSGGGVEDAFSSALLERLRGADVLVVNNEFPYSRRGVALPGKLYTFQADPASTSFLRQMGADLAGLANNHVFDYGPDAFEDTLAALEQEGIPYIGAGRDLEQAMRPQYFIVNGMKLAFVAATRAEKFIFTQEAGATQPGVLRTYEPDLFLQAVTEARKNSDFVAAYVHWGTENTAVLETAQREQARQYIEAGADIVVGAHPHCLQGFAFEHGKHVAYSLGNFWFNMDTVETGFLSVRITAPGEYSVQFEPCIQHGGRTTLMEDAEGAALLQYLRALSPGVRIYADGTLELEQPEL